VGSFERVDVRVGLAPLDGRWEAALYGRDGFCVTRERGRRYGIQFTYNFGG
jgi:hypothetical protein